MAKTTRGRDPGRPQKKSHQKKPLKCNKKITINKRKEREAQAYIK